MGAYDHFDRRLETLVMEESTVFDDGLRELTDDDQRWLAAALHARPHRAATVRYVRHHTGFCREIHATGQDVERLYREQILKNPAGGGMRS